MSANRQEHKKDAKPLGLLTVKQTVLRDICLIMFGVLLLFGIINFRMTFVVLAVTDIVLAVVMLVVAWRLQYRYPTESGDGLVVLLCGAIVVVMSTYTNEYGVFWAYVLSVGAFFVTDRRTALRFNFAFILLTAALVVYSAGLAVGIRVVVTLSLVAIFAYLFSSRIQEQAHQAMDNVDDLERANAAKSEFIANMSHEMRTPLTTVMGYAESMLNEDRLDPSSRERLGTIASSAKSLSVLVDDVLDLSRMQNGQLSINTVNVELQQYLTELSRVWTEAASKKELEFLLKVRSPLPRFIQTDPMRLSQILSNLLGNAIKFTDSGSIELAIEYRSRDCALIFQVIDSGVGVVPEFQEKLFQQFTQGDSSMTRNYHGVGLGLYISKNLSSLLSADLEYMPQDEGSIFQLSLHLESNPDEWIEPEDVVCEVLDSAPAVGKGFRGHILIVEDSTSIQLLIGLLAEQMGVTHSVVDNGLEAVERLRVESFDLVLMDLQMPVMSGIEAIREIRQYDADTPVVALSADVLLYDKDSGDLDGFTGLLAKPVHTSQLRTIFEQHLHAVR